MDKLLWAIVKLGYCCNNNCLFCHGAEHRQKGELDTGAVKKIISEAREAGFSGLWFSGGEPTIRADIIEILKYCQSLGLGSGLVTNGRRMLYLSFVDRLCEAGLSRLLVSCHGSEEHHDRLVGVAGAWTQVVQGLENMSKAGSFDVCVNSLLVRDSLAPLSSLIPIVSSLGVKWKLGALEPRGPNGVCDMLACPQWSKDAVDSLFNLAQAQGMSPASLFWDGLPHCLMSRRLAQTGDLYRFDIGAIRETWEKGFPPVDYLNMSRVEACGFCKASRCFGWWCRAWLLYPDFMPTPYENEPEYEKTSMASQ